MLRVVEEAALTDTGRERHANEDAYLVRPPVFVVADGMGGAQAGEVASRIAADAFDQRLDGDSTEQALANRVKETNRRIYDLAREDESRSGMGTTLTGATLVGDEISIAHVGDSRAYLLRDEKLRQLTRDHSLVEELRRQGRLTSEEAEGHPQRSIITRALGPEPEVEVDVHTHQARPGDVYLICSDGLTSMVREAQIQETLTGSQTLKEAVGRLVSAANEAGGRDNITVVCFKVGGELDAPAVDDQSQETITNLHVRDLPAAETPAQDTRAREPRVASRSRRWPRRAVIAAVVLVLLTGAALAAQAGIRGTYFIGQNEHGLLTLYRGVPYELPTGIKLYEEDYVSSVPTRSLRPLERKRLLDHQLRSRGDAADVIRTVERGEQRR